MERMRKCSFPPRRGVQATGLCNRCAPPGNFELTDRKWARASELLGRCCGDPESSERPPDDDATILSIEWRSRDIEDSAI
jgi:hypothetical protein